MFVLFFIWFINFFCFFEIGYVYDILDEVIGGELVGLYSDIYSGICWCYGGVISWIRKIILG